MVTEESSDDENLFGDDVRVFPLGKEAREAETKSFQRHVLVCTDKREGGCLSKGGKDVQKTFQNAVIEQKLDRVKVSSVNSMDFCDKGPVCVIYPDGVWYEAMSPEKARKVIKDHLKGGVPVSEYQFEPNLPEGFQHFIVCVFMANCAAAGGGDLARYLLSQAQRTPDVKVTTSNGCLKECSMGPVCCRYPDGEWFTGVTEHKYDAVWKSHEEGDSPSIYKTGQIDSDTETS